MNRQQKRNQQRELDKKTRTVNLTQEQIEHLIKEGISDGIKNIGRKMIIECTEMFELASKQALHEEFGFGVKRIDKFTTKLNEIVAEISKENFTVSDMKEWYEEYRKGA